MEFEGPPKRPLIDRIKERLQKAFGKQSQPKMPEGGEGSRQTARGSRRGQAVEGPENMVLDKVALEKAMERLSAARRDAVRLVYMEGKSVREAAEELGISQSGVRSRLEGAYREIRFRLRER